MIDQSTPPPKIATTERNENKSRLLPNEINAKLLDYARISNTRLFVSVGGGE